jgi:hypothetical protein
MKTQIIKSFSNYKGGINNMPHVQVISGFLTLAHFTGETAEQRAKRFQKQFEAGLTPNNH